jgi:hypothetical protein
MNLESDLFRPKHLWTRQEVMEKLSPVPKSPGVYAWYFADLDGRVPSSACHECDAFRLLYIGISPSAPPRNGKAPSAQSLRHRIRYHFSGNAEGSTLRLTLGCLLADKLGIQLRRVGSGRRMTFSLGESALSKWMDENARVVWHVCGEPWRTEERLISELDLPLNLDQNRHHAFHAVLSGARSTAKSAARALPTLSR